MVLRVVPGQSGAETERHAQNNTVDCWGGGVVYQDETTVSEHGGCSQQTLYLSLFGKGSVAFSVFSVKALSQSI